MSDAEEPNGFDDPTPLTEANLSSHDGFGAEEPEFDDPQDAEDDKFLTDELERINKIEDEKEKEEALIEYREKRRELLKNKIKRMHSRMEAKLQTEVAIYEDMEEEEVVATWKLDQRMKEREELKRVAAEEKQRREEEERRAQMTEEDFKKETEEARLRFIAEGMKGQLFLQHKKNMFGKNVKSEKFIRISVYEHGEPRAITWGGGGAKKMIEFLDIVNIVTGHVTQVFENSKTDEGLCFSIVTTKRTLDLESHDDETCNKWVEGLRLILTNLDADNDQPVQPTQVGGNGPETPPAQKATHRQQDSMQITQEELFVYTVETVLEQMNGELKPPDGFDFRTDGKTLYKKVLADRLPWRKWNEWVKDQLQKGFPALSETTNGVDNPDDAPPADEAAPEPEPEPAANGDANGGD